MQAYRRLLPCWLAGVVDDAAAVQMNVA